MSTLVPPVAEAIVRQRSLRAAVRASLAPPDDDHICECAVLRGVRSIRSIQELTETPACQALLQAIEGTALPPEWSTREPKNHEVTLFPHYSLLTAAWPAGREAGALHQLVGLHLLAWPPQDPAGYRPALRLRQAIPSGLADVCQSMRWSPSNATVAMGRLEALADQSSGALAERLKAYHASLATRLEEMKSPRSRNTPRSARVSEPAPPCGEPAVDTTAPGPGLEPAPAHPPVAPGRTRSPARGDVVEAGPTRVFMRAEDPAADARRDDDESSPADATRYLADVHSQRAGGTLTLATSERHQTALVEQVSTDQACRAIRPGRWTTGEWRMVLQAAHDAPDGAPLVVACLYAVGTLGMAWDALPSVMRPVDPAGEQEGITLSFIDGAWHGTRVFLARTLPPPPDGTDMDLLVPVASRFALRMHPGVAQRLATVLELLPGSRRSPLPDGGQRLLWSAPLTLALFDAACRNLDLSSVPRHDAGRVQSLMRSILDQHHPDQTTLVGLLCPGELPTHSRDHYALTPVATLQRAWHRAQAHILDVPEGICVPPQQPAPQAAHVGSPRVPHEHVAAQALTRAQGRVKHTHASFGDSLDRWVMHHNARVDAWAVLLCITMGLRRSLTLHEPDGIDDGLRFVVICDKGEVARLLPLTSVHRRRWDLFSHHLKRMARSAPELARLVGAGSTTLQQWRQRLTRLEVHARGFVARPWTPSDADRLLESFGLRVPIHLFRHGAQVACRSAGYPGYLVDAMMGHYQRGTEPGNAYSLYSHHDLLNSLDAMVETRVRNLLGQGP